MGKNVNQISTKLEAHVVGGVNPGSMSERERMRGLKKSYCPLAGVAINANAKAHYTTDDMCVRYEDISKLMPTSGSSGTLRGYYNVRVVFKVPVNTVFWGSSYDISFGTRHYTGELNDTALLDITTSTPILIEGYEKNLITITCSNLQYKISSTGDIRALTNGYIRYYSDTSISKTDTFTISNRNIYLDVSMSDVDAGYKVYSEKPIGSGSQADPYIIELFMNFNIK